MRCGNIFSPSIVLVVCLVLILCNFVYADRVGRTHREDQTLELKLIRSTKTKRTIGPLIEKFHSLSTGKGRGKGDASVPSTDANGDSYFRPKFGLSPASSFPYGTTGSGRAFISGLGNGANKKSGNEGAFGAVRADDDDSGSK